MERLVQRSLSKYILKIVDGIAVAWSAIQEYTEKRMSDFGFETIAGDTDSIFVVWKGKDALCPPPKENDAFSEQKFVKACLKTIVEEIKANVPFPAETFKIDIEHDNALDYACGHLVLNRSSFLTEQTPRIIKDVL
jgi:hypothetical protein